MIRFFFTIGCIFFCSCLRAQDFNNGNTYFFLGLRLPAVSVRDLGHSPLIYRGWSPTLIVGYEKRVPEFVSRFEASISFGNASPTMKPHTDRMLSSMGLNTIEIVYSYFRGVNTYATDDWNNYLGGRLSLLIDTREYNLPSNNLYGYHVNTSLNIAGRTQKKLSDTWWFQYEANTALLAFSFRPNYNGTFSDMSTETGMTKKFLKSGNWVTLPTYFRFTNNFSFAQNINDSRERRLSYQWDFLHHTRTNPLTFVSGGLAYESLFKL